MGTWKIKQISRKPQLRNTVFIEGLPGIGNVGKVAVDFILDEIGAKKLFEVTSYTFPHSVFVNEDNLVELPAISVYYKKGKTKDFLFLAGDVQPVDEVSSYEFSDKILDILQEFNVQEIITLGGIGLAEVPKNPKVYCTASEPDIVRRYRKGTKIDNQLYGVVGPIVGVTGLLIGLARDRKIPAIAFLAETYGHPLYLGVRGAREILKILNSKHKLKLDMNELDSEIEKMEDDMIKKTEQLSEVSKKTALSKLKKITEMDYIG